jgi:hypothetical protein
MVDNDGKNKYYGDENWLTDGYGDYIRHYLRAIAAMPELARPDENHLLSSTSIVQQIGYHNYITEYQVPSLKSVDPGKIILYYRTFDNAGTEQLHLTRKPGSVVVNGKIIAESKTISTVEGYHWQQLKEGGTLTINRKSGSEVIVTQ